MPTHQRLDSWPAHTRTPNKADEGGKGLNAVMITYTVNSISILKVSTLRSYYSVNSTEYYAQSETMKWRVRVRCCGAVGWRRVERANLARGPRNPGTNSAHPVGSSGGTALQLCSICSIRRTLGRAAFQPWEQGWESYHHQIGNHLD